MRRTPKNDGRLTSADDRQWRSRKGDHLPNSDLYEWLSPAKPPSLLDLCQLEQQAEHILEDLGIHSEGAHDFFKYVPPRLTQIRLQVSALGKAQGAAKQQVCLAGLSMQVQWLAGYARMAGFHAVTQVGSALESMAKSLYDQPARINESSLRTIAQSVDLLSALARTAPNATGRAEGAKVLVVDEDPNSRVSALAALERHGISAIGLATPETALTILRENPMDVILVSSRPVPTTSPQFCHAIRRLPRQGLTPVLVLSPETQWENRAVLAMSGATEVVPGPLFEAELALKVLAHFFRGRLSQANG